MQNDVTLTYKWTSATIVLLKFQEDDTHIRLVMDVRIQNTDAFVQA